MLPKYESGGREQVILRAMSRQNLKLFSMNFIRCGIAGWCLEVVFTALDSLARGNWKMMGQTSLIMFPIYGLGGSVVSHGPSGRLVGRRAGGKSRSPDYGIKTCGAIHSSRTPLYGVDFSDGIPVGPMAHGSWSLPVGLFHLAGQYRRSNPSGFRAFMVRNRIVV